MIDSLIIQETLAAATICKVLVDLVRQTAKVESWSYPLLALFFGIISSILLILSTNTVLDTNTVSRAVISGILAAGSAMGVTELQKRAL